MVSHANNAGSFKFKVQCFRFQVSYLFSVLWYFANFTLRYALRATQDEIGREKRILTNPVETPELGVSTKMPPQRDKTQKKSVSIRAICVNLCAIQSMTE